MTFAPTRPGVDADMTRDRTVLAMAALSTTVIILAAVAVARPILAPVAFALFVIAIVWPLQRHLQARLPTLLALAVTIIVTAVAVSVMASLVVWGVGRSVQWLIANGARFQVLYGQGIAWLDGHGLQAAGLWAEHFNVAWLIRILQEVTGRLHTAVSFLVVAFVFVILGLLEVETSRRKLEALGDGEYLSRACAVIATKLQQYMLVRTVMSVLTGSVVWAFTAAFGLDLALAWGAIAFALNYIPFIGPLIATVLPTLLAIAQFESWQAGITVFVALNVIQFLSGSYIEPRVAGARLSISPFMVLFAVFFWSFLWGLAGAFIGVPILIAVVTLFELHPSTYWLAGLLSGEERPSA
jgi:AI-2 transport protein TqsA